MPKFIVSLYEKSCEYRSILLGSLIPQSYTVTTTLSAIYGYNREIYDNFILPRTVVGIATGYGLDGPGIETRWWRDFPHQSRPALGLTQPPAQWVPRPSRWQRAAGA